LSISKKCKLPRLRDQHLRARRLQQRSQCGRFRPALRGVIAGLRGAVRIGAVMTIRRCFKVAGIQDASRVKPRNGGDL
jgi:hypothetical protein